MWSTTVRALVLVMALGALLVTGAACGSNSSGESTGGASSTPAPAAAVAAGDSVAAKWDDGSYYLATVSEVNGEDVSVTYADDGSSNTVKMSDVRPILGRTFAIGDRVLAVWSGGRFYAGEISEANGAVYVVEWDDGSTPSEVDAAKIIAE